MAVVVGGGVGLGWLRLGWSLSVMAEGRANSRDRGGDYLSTKGGGGIGRMVKFKKYVVS